MKNDFIDDLQKNKEFIVTKENCKDLEKQIDDYFMPKGQEDKFNVVYVYSLIKENINTLKAKAIFYILGIQGDKFITGKTLQDLDLDIVVQGMIISKMSR